MRSHNPSLLKEAVLYVLYSESISVGGRLSTGDVMGRLPEGSATTTLISFAIDELSSKKLIDVDPYSNRPYKISRRGYDYVRYRQSLEGSAIHSYSKSKDWLLGNETPYDDSPIVPAIAEDKEDVWAPLPIDRDDPEFVAVVNESERALDTIKGDNGYAEHFPEERGNILWTIGTGINALKEGLISRQQVEALLIRPLGHVARRLQDGVTAEAAKIAAKAIVEWLKSFF